MNVTSPGECGISPFLLQAISSLTAPESQPDRARDKPEPQVMEKQQNENVGKGVTHLLQGMHEPVSALVTSSSPSVSNGDPDRDSIVNAKSEEVTLNAAVQERLATQLAIKQGRLVAASSLGSAPSPDVSDVSMVNVLTALASQHMKANIKQEEGMSYSYASVAAPTFTTTTATSVGNMIMQPAIEGSDSHPQPQIIIYYNNHESGAVSSASSNIVLGEMDGEKMPGSVQNYRVVLQHGDASTATLTSVSEPSIQSMVSEAASVAAASVLSDNPGTFVAADTSSNTEPTDAVCPVCGDKISGYHYGVYTCESCKGFFKRTVQNKKSFMCHKQNDCEIVLQNRKKCPACRFNKCILVGMKLEAIRQDRTRGGRSSYNGSLPLVKPKSLSTPRKSKRPSTEGGEANVKMGAVTVMPELQMMAPEEGGKGHRQLVAILNHSSTPGQQVPDAQGLPVPELLTDIMNLEALLVDDDVPAEGAVGGDMRDEQAFYNYLMQLTELRLYKLVRWARNLPQFGAISTDDQIILLQNCWSDLLALGVCWRSIGSPSVLIISATQSISQEQAEAMGFGDVMARLLSISESLQRLGVDQYEYVALKVLLLISPDVKGLKEPSKIQEYQEKLSEALMEYTSAHYAQAPSKYGEMLLRLPELARISFLAKEILLLAFPPSLSSCGLLVELLKGENAVKE